MTKSKRKKLAAKRKKWWENEGRFSLDRRTGEPHPKGYCGDQMCCWGKIGDKVKWA